MGTQTHVAKGVCSVFRTWWFGPPDDVRGWWPSRAVCLLNVCKNVRRHLPANMWRLVLESFSRVEHLPKITRQVRHRRPGVAHGHLAPRRHLTSCHLDANRVPSLRRGRSKVLVVGCTIEEREKQRVMCRRLCGNRDLSRGLYRGLSGYAGFGRCVM